MSKRKRHSAKPITEHAIEWLKHRAGYPSLEEREQIIRLRAQLKGELLLLRLTNKGDKRGFDKLVEKYGEQEVDRATTKFNDGMELSSRVSDDARGYREYRLRFSKFGAGLKFHSVRELNESYVEYFKHIKNDISDDADINGSLAKQHEEIERQLMIGWRDWDDLVPPAAPPRPAEYPAPQLTAYPAPINELLERGNDLDRSHEFTDEADRTRWKKSIPALTRMALDPNLLNGWCADASSWAPWHAIHMLGVLQAWESAPALVQLAGIENDWFSDHLPHIWADMGIEVEPALWMILESRAFSTKQRGLAAEALFKMAEDSNAIHVKAAAGFEKTLNNTAHYDPKLNGYLIMFLKDMEIPLSAESAIYKAFEENRVAPEIMTLADYEEDFED